MNGCKPWWQEAVTGDNRRTDPELGLRESVIYVEVDAQSGKENLGELETALNEILADVRAAVEDWRVVLAKIGRAEFHEAVLPGSQLRFSTVVEDIQDDGAITTGTVEVDGRPQANIGLVFAHLDDRFPDPLFDPHMLLGMLRMFQLYDVGRCNGERIVPPPHLLEAELEEFGDC